MMSEHSVNSFLLYNNIFFHKAFYFGETIKRGFYEQFVTAQSLYEKKEEKHFFK